MSLLDDSCWKNVPQYSRAVDDSDDDSDSDLEAEVEREKQQQQRQHCVLRIAAKHRQELQQNNGKLQCSTLLIGIGPAASAFLAAHVLGNEAERVGLITCGLPVGVANTLGQSALTDCTTYLWRLADNPSVLCVRVAQEPDIASCWSFSEALFSILDCDGIDCAILTSDELMHYKSELPSSELAMQPQLRYLNTSSMHFKPSAGNSAIVMKQLEQPNLITGLAAQLLSDCHMQRIPAVAFIAYYPDAQSLLRPDTMAVGAYKPLLHCQPLRNCRSVWPRDADALAAAICASVRSHTSTVYT